MTNPTEAASHNADAVHARPGFAAFEALVQARMTQPFAWGTQDCCLWAADAVQALTGLDHAAEFRGTYQTAVGAAKALAAAGGLAALAARAGHPIAPLLACGGDVGIVSVDETEVLGVCAGPVWLVAATEGLGVVAFDACTAAWKVAHA